MDQNVITTRSARGRGRSITGRGGRPSRGRGKLSSAVTHHSSLLEEGMTDVDFCKDDDNHEDASEFVSSNTSSRISETHYPSYSTDAITEEASQNYDSHRTFAFHQMQATTTNSSNNTNNKSGKSYSNTLNHVNETNNNSRHQQLASVDSPILSSPLRTGLHRQNSRSSLDPERDRPAGMEDLDDLGGFGREHETLEERKDRLARMMQAVRDLLLCLGEDVTRAGLLDTPRRVAKALDFMTRGYTQVPSRVIRNAIFPEDHDDMVIVKVRKHESFTRAVCC